MYINKKFTYKILKNYKKNYKIISKSLINTDNFIYIKK